jgi:hypothetical protein
LFAWFHEHKKEPPPPSESRAKTDLCSEPFQSLNLQPVNNDIETKSFIPFDHPLSSAPSVTQKYLHALTPEVSSALRNPNARRSLDSRHSRSVNIPLESVSSPPVAGSTNSNSPPPPPIPREQTDSHSRQSSIVLDFNEDSDDGGYVSELETLEEWTDELIRGDSRPTRISYGFMDASNS